MRLVVCQDKNCGGCLGWLAGEGDGGGGGGGFLLGEVALDGAGAVEGPVGAFGVAGAAAGGGEFLEAGEDGGVVEAEGGFGGVHGEAVVLFGGGEVAHLGLEVAEEDVVAGGVGVVVALGGAVDDEGLFEQGAGELEVAL